MLKFWICSIFLLFGSNSIYSQDSASLTRVINYCNDQLRLNPQSIYYREIRADSKYSLGDLAGALSDYKSIINKKEDKSGILYKMGLVFYYQNKYKLADQYFNSSIKSNHTNYDAFFALALLKEVTLDFSAAISNYTKAIDINPSIATVYNNRGYVYQTLDLDSLAIQDFSKAINIDSTSVNSYYNRGYSKFKTKDIANGLSDVNHALKLEPNNVFAIKILILIYDKTGDFDRKCKILSQYKNVLKKNGIFQEPTNCR